MLQKDPNDGNTLLRLSVPLRNCTTVTVVSRYATLPVNKMIGAIPVPNFQPT